MGSDAAASLDNINNGNCPSDNLEPGPMRLYEHRVSNGELRPDENQRIVVEHLHQLSLDIERYMQRRTFRNHVITDLTSVCHFALLLL